MDNSVADNSALIAFLMEATNASIEDVTTAEDDRKPAAVECREPRDLEKGEGGGGRVKLPPSATTRSKHA